MAHPLDHKPQITGKEGPYQHLSLAALYKSNSCFPVRIVCNRGIYLLDHIAFKRICDDIAAKAKKEGFSRGSGLDVATDIDGSIDERLGGCRWFTGSESLKSWLKNAKPIGSYDWYLETT